MINTITKYSMNISYNVITAAQKAGQYIVTTAKTPLQQNLLLASASLTCIILTFRSHAAMAEGFAGLMDTAAEQSEDMQKSFQNISAAAGVVAVGTGLFKWWRKSQEGDHSQIKTTHIAGPILAGVTLGALSFILSKAGETIGIADSDRIAID